MGTSFHQATIEVGDKEQKTASSITASIGHIDDRASHFKSSS
jgi:hypothetical protein